MTDGMGENNWHMREVISKLQLIYKALQDEESKLILEKRFMYSVSNSEAYIVEMIHSLIDQYGTCDAVHCLLQWLKQMKKRKIVIFGAGCACRQLLWILKTYDVTVDYICDNNTNFHGSIMYGKSVISPAQLKEMLADVCIIVGVNWYGNEICSQLWEMGVDAERVFTSEHGWWLGKVRQYFDPDIIKPSKQEIFVDGGAYTGEDTIEFLKWCYGQARCAYLFEPDEKNYQKCIENMKLYEEKVKIYNKGLWSHAKQMVFSNNRNANSAINENGSSIVSTMVIDEIANEEQITFIKMDIEGAELEALKGAAGTIQKNKPKLAICVYHKPEDILDIPAYILELNAGYRLYLRHYSYTAMETVLYAI